MFFRVSTSHCIAVYFQLFAKKVTDTLICLLAQQRTGKGRSTKGEFDWANAKTAEEMSQLSVDTGNEDLEFVIQDLLSFPTDRGIVVDTYAPCADGLLLVSDIRNVVYLISTDAFQQEVLKKRSQERELEIKENYFEHRRLLSEHVRGKANRFGIPVIVSGGELSFDETYSAVCQHFGLNKISLLKVHGKALQSYTHIRLGCAAGDTGYLTTNDGGNALFLGVVKKERIEPHAML